MRRGRHRWLRRAVLAAALVVVAFVPGQAPSTPASSCPSAHCGGNVGAVRWIRPLPGSWVAATSVLGTVPAARAGSGQVYAAAGKSVAAVGFGMTVYAYRARDGQALWTAQLSGFPAGSQIVSVRVWPGVVTVGVARASGAARRHPARASRRRATRGHAPRRHATRGARRHATGAGSPRVTESAQSAVVLRAGDGRQLRSFPAAPFGGAIAANSQDTVVIGPTSVTSYDNATGQVNWMRATGRTTQAWQPAGDYLYLTRAAGGSLGSQPVTELRRINLRTGSEQDIRARGGGFAGRLGAALDGVLLFSGGQGVTAYSASSGMLLWQRAGAVPESVDLVSGLFYLTVGSTLTGVQPWTGQVEVRVTGANSSGSGGIYGVRNGVALGLDQGPAGEAWGYDVAGQRVIWSTRVLPWPHYFVDLSGIGGSTDPGSDTVILTACAQRIQSGAQQICQRPQLVLIDR